MGAAATIVFMPHRLTLCFIMTTACCSLVACKKAPKQRLQGKWVGARAENFNARQAEAASGWAQAMAFEFKGSSVKVSIPAETPRQGTFKIAKVNGQDLTVRFMRPHGPADRVAFQFDGESKLRWQLPGGRSILLRRVD